jgi:putative transposase
MSNLLHNTALFRLSVLGPLACRGQFERGELKKIISELAAKTYNIPGAKRVHLSEQTITRWYYKWLQGGVKALAPKARSDKGQSQLPESLQATILQIKKDNPARSINTIIDMCERNGMVAKGKLSRASVHRFLQQQQNSKQILADVNTIERRSFVAEHAGDIWQGDVLHGPSIQTPKGLKKTYLVSLLDDASRLIAHAAFCLGETALDIEGVLKQAILKRGLPHKLIIDNGSAYRSESLQTICALLKIRIIYCRPYEAEGKGKLERYHRTLRGMFLSEIDLAKISGLSDLNARLWAWLEQVYHQRPHEGLQGKAPIARWREELVHVRRLDFDAIKLDDIFYHRHERTVRKDGSVNWESLSFEVPHGLVGEKVKLVVDPHTKTAIKIESVFGEDLGPVTLQDKIANLNRKRQRPHRAPTLERTQSAVELAYNEYSKICCIPTANKSSNGEK